MIRPRGDGHFHLPLLWTCQAGFCRVLRAFVNEGLSTTLASKYIWSMRLDLIQLHVSIATTEIHMDQWVRQPLKEVLVNIITTVNSKASSSEQFLFLPPANLQLTKKLQREARKTNLRPSSFHKYNGFNSIKQGCLTKGTAVIKTYNCGVVSAHGGTQ